VWEVAGPGQWFACDPQTHTAGPSMTWDGPSWRQCRPSSGRPVRTGIGSSGFSIRHGRPSLPPPRRWPGPAGGTALAAWLHDLCSPVTAIVGWARMLELAGDPAIQAHAVEAIDRNAKLLTERLGNPPVWPAGVDGEQSEAA
jgi:hypothetical protein